MRPTPNHPARQRALLACVLALLVCLSSCTPAQTRQQKIIIDLTHPFDEQTIFWPTEEGFSLERAFRGITPGGYFYSANRFRTAEHGGTHIDAPIHFHQERKTLDTISLHRLIGAGVVVDVRSQCQKNPDCQIGIDDFREWEKRFRSRLDDVMILLNTGFSRFWPDRARYLGTRETGSLSLDKLHFPGLHPEAAQWLVGNRRVKAIGLDTASIDYGQSKDFRSHIILAADNIPIFENVNQTSELPPKDFTIMALPMKIKGGSGGPLRIVALLDP